jgi:hypothetical protein
MFMVLVKASLRGQSVTLNTEILTLAKSETVRKNVWQFFPLVHSAGSLYIHQVTRIPTSFFIACLFAKCNIKVWYSYGPMHLSVHSPLTEKFERVP